MRLNDQISKDPSDQCCLFQQGAALYFLRHLLNINTSIIEINLQTLQDYCIKSAGIHLNSR